MQIKSPFVLISVFMSYLIYSKKTSCTKHPEDNLKRLDMYVTMTRKHMMHSKCITYSKL